MLHAMGELTKNQMEGAFEVEYVAFYGPIDEKPNGGRFRSIVFYNFMGALPVTKWKELSKYSVYRRVGEEPNGRSF